MADNPELIQFGETEKSGAVGARERPLPEIPVGDRVVENPGVLGLGVQALQEQVNEVRMHTWEKGN